MADSLKKQQLPRIGVDLGGTKIEAAAVLPNGNVAARHRIVTPRGDYGATVTAIAELVARIETEFGGPCNVGVGIPGAVSPKTDLVKNANSVWLIGQALDRDLERHLARPVRIANDANCFALSEALDGAGKGEETIFGVILGTGVGAGIVHRGRLLTGRNAIGGEWGHNPLPWPNDDERPGRPCYCGRRGCIETFLSGPGLAAAHQAATGRDWAAQKIAERAAAGDQAAEAALARYEGQLARALATVINILDPDRIVLGGGLSNIGRLYCNVPALWDPYIFSDRVETELVAPLHGDSSGVRGAAWLWPAE